MTSGAGTTSRHEPSPKKTKTKIKPNLHDRVIRCGGYSIYKGVIVWITSARPEMKPTRMLHQHRVCSSGILLVVAVVAAAVVVAVEARAGVEVWA